MKFLFIHDNFPAQFRHIAEMLAKDIKNQVVFATRFENNPWEISRVQKVVYTLTREPTPNIHNYVIPIEAGALTGQAFYRLASGLKSMGFVPDIIIGHSGWGSTLFVKDVYPETPFLGYFEWFYNYKNSDVDFDPNDPITTDEILKLRTKNTPILIDLYSCDYGMCPTNWQKSQFPKEYQNKLHVLHDGIDTNFFKPIENSKLILPKLNLSEVDEIVTYVSRGFEPYRGFPQFVESIAYLLEKRPNCHIVIAGSDRVCYGKPLENGKNYREHYFEKFDLLNNPRVHYVGSLPYAQYLKLLQASSAHIYLTRPFVLSWSMLEAMSTGCIVIGSDTPPIQEVIQDGENGFLVDFFSPKKIADKISEVLENQKNLEYIRKNARDTIIEKYAHYEKANILLKYSELLKKIARKEEF